MAVDLTKFDWSAIGAIGQVAAAVATIVSLWLLWRQIRLTRDQVKEGQESLRLAMAQVEESRRQAEQARHDAVLPVLIVANTQAYSDHNECGDLSLKASGQPIHFSCKLRNVGFAPANGIRVLTPEGREVGCCSVLPVGESWVWGETISRPVTELAYVLEWRDVFHKAYTNTFVLNDEPTVFRVSVHKGSGALVEHILHDYVPANH